MKYTKLSMAGTFVQLYKKVLRKFNSIVKYKKRSHKIDFYEISNTLQLNFQYNKDTSLKIILSDNPPYETFMFFPLGKSPDMTESFCFIAYKNGEIAGWSWLHKGLRNDTDIAHSIKNDENFIWFGPDFVKPKFRGISLQKVLIYERLLFAKKEFSSETKFVTIIGQENYPSIRSYSFFGFEKKSINDYIS